MAESGTLQMSRKDVYEACTVVLHIGDNKSFAEHKLTPKMIDAIIDCAVEEAVERMKGKGK